MARKQRRPPIVVEPRQASEPSGLLGDSEPSAAYLGEILRRVALGLTLALVTARAYWYAEGLDEIESGSGLLWSLLMVVTFAIASTAAWLDGGMRLRRSWADLAVLILFALVALSACWADEKRIAANRAWEWAGVGLAYLLFRNLPRTRGESSAMAAVLVATAVAISAYGLYQVKVEHVATRAEYLKNPREILMSVGVDPKNAASVKRFEDRLLGSKEPLATFALANTLAGFLVGPAAVGLALAFRNLRGTNPPTSRVAPVLLAAAPLLCGISCLLLTKSRSAYVGLGVAILILAWRSRGGVSRKAIALSSAGLIAAVAGLIAVATLAGQFDAKVLTESSKSLTYRMEFWKGAWGVIGDGPKTWWAGLGPGNFSGPYMKHKLPQASEEISDPHNLFLEVWTTAGLFAMLALTVALGWGFREAFGPPKPTSPDPIDPQDPPPPASSGWLFAAGGIGGWLLVVAMGQLNPFEDDRWILIGAAWAIAAALGRPLWNRLPLSGDVLALGSVAIAVNLLAAGGIGFAPVALMMWGLLAIALNLREDRPCGVARRLGGRVLAFVPMAASAAMLGTFLGTAVPFWSAQKWISQGDALAAQRVPDFEHAQQAYAEANRIDRLGKRGWVARANLSFREWLAKGKPPDLLLWEQINSALDKATIRPRNPFAIAVYRMRAATAEQFLAQPDLVPTMKRKIQLDRKEACAKAVALYPNDASLRADYAYSLGDLNEPVLAAAQAVRALELDRITPHQDKKLPDEVREAISRDLESWDARS